MRDKRVSGLIILGFLLALAGQAEGERRMLPIKITQERELSLPRLNVSLINEELVLVKDRLEEPAEFRLFSNYLLFFDKWKLEILDAKTRKLIKVFEGNTGDLYKPIFWDGRDEEGNLIKVGRSYIYVLTVYDKNGRWDRTREKLLDVRSPMSDAKVKASDIGHPASNYQKWIEQEGKINHLEVQSIPIRGDLVTMSGEGFETEIDEGVTPQARLEVIRVRIEPEGKESILLTPTSAVRIDEFSLDFIVPKGNYKVLITSFPSGREYTKTIRVKDSYFFFVALADTEIGYTSTQGNIEPVEQDDKFRQGFWSEGKLAYYLKGKIKGKYLITSSLDTEREKKELFRNLDPDKYYPVYGDTSTINYDATNTQGLLYLLIEWDKSSLHWGNYETGLTGTELATFSRTLYGGKLHYESVSTTQFGEPKTELIVFGAEAKQKASHNEFLGTGGSLYYLKHRDIIEGSEKVALEVRDKITGLVLERLEQKEDADYEIDYSNGRLMFHRPVSWIVESNSIISTSLLDGYSIHLVVDYEYEVKDKYDEGSYGVRASQTLTDYLPSTISKVLGMKLGSTYVKEEKEAENYQLKGVDATLYLGKPPHQKFGGGGKETKLVAEYAESESEEVNSFVSLDGGLNFTQLSTSELARGKAYGLKGESEIIDNLGLTGYYKKLEPGFSTTSTISQQGKELLGAGLTYDISPQTRLNLSHDIQKLIEGGNLQTALQVGAEKTETSMAQLVHEKERLRLTGEYRHQRVHSPLSTVHSETSEEGDIVAARADYWLNPKLELSLEQQATVKGNPNHQTTAGLVAEVFDWLDLKAEEMVGTRGSATSLGLESARDGTTTYGYYNLADSNIDGKKNSVVFGSSRRVSENLDFIAEKEYSRMKNTTSNTNILGLSGDINEQVGMRANYERGIVEEYDGSEAVRNAGSVGLSYVGPVRSKSAKATAAPLVRTSNGVDKDLESGRAKIQASTKIEVRLDEGDEDKRQFLTHNAVEWKVISDLTLFAQANLSQTENKTSNFIEAEYKELVGGIAFRPLNFDRFNLLAKCTYLSDDSPSGQSNFADIEEEKARIYALEGVYDLTARLQVVEKFAYRIGEEQVTGFDFTKTRTWLWLNRLNYEIMERWHIGGEYRLLTQKEAEDSKQGVLVELVRELGEFVELGGGYNWTDFNDDLTALDYTCQGPFLRLTGKFYDRTPEEIERLEEIREERRIKAWTEELVREELARPGSKIMEELYHYFYLGRVAQREGRLKEAKEFYQIIIKTGRKLEEEAEEYVRERIAFEERLKGYNDLAKKYYQEGKLEQAKALWERVLLEAKEGGW